MWKNLRDVGSLAQKIGQVVAPTGGAEEEYSDDEEYYDEEEEEEENEDGSYNSEEEEEEANQYVHPQKDTSKASPFGLASLLAKAMDSEQYEYDESHSNEHREDERQQQTALMTPEDEQEHHEHGGLVEEVEIEKEHYLAQPHEESLGTAGVSTLPSEKAKTNDNHSIPPVMDRYPSAGSSILSGNEGHHEVETANDPFHNHHHPPAISSSFTTKLSQAEEERRKETELYDSNNNMSMLSASERESAQDPEPARFGLVRESGSLSPQRSPPKPKTSLAGFFGGTDATSSALPLNDESDDTVESGRRKSLVSLDDDNGHYSDHEDDDGHTEQPPEKIRVEAKTTKEILSPRTEQKNQRDALLGSLSDAKLQPLQPYASQYSLNGEVDERKLKDRNDSRYGGDDDNLDKMAPRRVDSMTEEQTQPPQRAVFPRHSAPLYGSPFDVTKAPRRLDSMMEEDEEDLSEQQLSQKQAVEEASPASPKPAMTQLAPLESSETKVSHSSDDKRMGLLEKRCKELKRQLMNAEAKILDLQQQNNTIIEQDNSEHEILVQRFQEKEARLLQAAAEEHEQEMAVLRAGHEAKVASMHRELIQERHAFQGDREHLQKLLSEANARSEQMERLLEHERAGHDQSASQIQQQQARALRMAEDKLAHTLALLDEREENVKHLKTLIQTMESKMSEHREGAQEAEEEMDELHSENEVLHNHVEQLQTECKRLKEQVQRLEGDSEKLVHLKMELRMLKEDHNREKAKVQQFSASAESNTAQLEAERDEALAKLRDMQLQLSAALADLDIARSDTERVMKANNNLQAALEAFQNEREAEMAMVEETQREREEATAAAHAAALEATHEAHQAELRQMQQMADAAVSNSMDEIRLLEEKLEKFRIENVQTRRSLDEAIQRLQQTQDDVIDRAFMKNILLDWLTKTDKKERAQVLSLMANVLHFTDEEKERVHIIDDSSRGLRKFVAPPPPKADLEHLAGENVREKWVNFLIAETED